MSIMLSFRRTGRNALALAGWVGLCFAAAAFGAQFSPGEWYAQLKKPSWNPPSWIFAPVWTALYTLMAIAAWLVWRHGGWLAQRGPLGWFLLQLLFNALWSWLFFGRHHPLLGLVDILFLWTTLFATIVAFWRVHRPAAAVLLMPYLAWVSFATALNYALWRINP